MQLIEGLNNLYPSPLPAYRASLTFGGFEKIVLFLNIFCDEAVCLVSSTCETIQMIILDWVVFSHVAVAYKLAQAFESVLNELLKKTLGRTVCHVIQGGLNSWIIG